MKNKYFVRNFEAEKYMEIFLVSAIFAILAIRLFLRLTGYPQIGNSELHIAHMLWGGLLMLISIIMLLFFLTKRATLLASLLGGLGFGTFVDEIGKFVTQDNDYFYEPAVALIYITFILILIAVNTIQTRWHRTPDEYVVNAINELIGIPIYDLDEFEKQRALSYLNESGSDNRFTKAIKEIFINTEPIPPPRPGIYTRTKSFLIEKYEWVTKFRFFNIGLIIFFALQFFITITYVIVLTFLFGIGWDTLNGMEAVKQINDKFKNITFIESAEFFTTLLSGLFIIAGIYMLRKSRLDAYQMFKRSVLVSIFLTQVFIFYKEQFSGMTGLVLNILILMALEFMIDREREKKIRSNV